MAPKTMWARFTVAEDAVDHMQRVCEAHVLDGYHTEILTRLFESLHNNKRLTDDDADKIISGRRAYDHLASETETLRILRDERLI